MSTLAPFVLSDQQLVDVRDTIIARINEGLSASGKELKALPAMIPMPTAVPQGNAVALDLGGTNIRAAGITISGNKAVISNHGGEDKQLLDANKNKTPVTRDQLFDRMAELVDKAQPHGDLPVGFIFSYPCVIQPDGGAKLVRWAKGVDIPDTVGQDVAKLLRDALLKRGRKVTKVMVMNDTVASLLAGVVAAPGCSHYVGVIAGTGTNMAGFFRVRDITKMTGGDPNQIMAVNIETGNYHPPHLTPIDDALDAKNVHDTPGTQRIEKAVSGMYLPQLFAEIIGHDKAKALGVDLTDKDAAGANMMKLKANTDFAGEVVRTLVARSADLLGATIAGLAHVYNNQAKTPAEKPTRVGLLGEGSLYLKNAEHRERLIATAQRLSPSGVSIVGVSADPAIGANNLGAACAVLG
jgi:hexokinase